MAFKNNRSALEHAEFVESALEVEYEDWKVAISYFEVGAYMFTFDFKSCYHHIEIATDHQCYNGFSWVDPICKRTQIYRFTVLPFRLSSAPHIFTKVLKPLVKPLVSTGG